MGRPTAEEVVAESRRAIDQLQALLLTLEGYVTDLEEEVDRRDEQANT